MTELSLPAAVAAASGLSELGDIQHQRWNRRRLALRRQRRLLPLCGMAGLVFMWWAIVHLLHVRPYVAPSPDLVLRTLWIKRKVLLANLEPTVIEAIGGFTLGSLSAVVVATVFVHFRILRDIFFPVVLIFNAIPVVAKAPILMLIMGNGMAPRVTIAALVSYFPTLINMVRGLESVNPQALELMQILSASRLEIFFRLRLFNSLPYLFSALRIAASMSVIGAIVGEWIGANAGIGALIIQATYNFDSSLLYASIVMSALLSGTFFLLVTFAERWIVRWQPEDASH